jgi:hypothetical protein
MNGGLEAKLDEILPILESREAALRVKPLKEIARDRLAGVEILGQPRPPPDDDPSDNGPQAVPMPVMTTGA